MFESWICSTFSHGIYGTNQNSSKHRSDSQCKPCDFPRVYTGLALTGPADCPRASCDLDIKYLMLSSHAWDPRVCPGSCDLGSRRSLWSLRRRYEITLLWWNCHMHSPGSLCVLAILAQYSMNPYVYSHGFGKVPLRMQCGHSQTPTATRAEPVWGKYRAVEPTCMDVFWTTHDSLRAQNRRKPSPSLKAVHAHLFQPRGYTAQYGSKNHRKIVQTRSAVILPPSLIRFLLCA